MKGPEPRFQVRTIRVGISNIHLVRYEQGLVLLDGGSRPAGERLLRFLHQEGLEPGQVRLLIASHVHYDHVQNLAALKRLCGCPLAVHQAEAQPLAQGKMVMPPGITWWARVAAWLGRKLWPPFLNHPPVQAEILVQGERSLADLGLAGRLVSTPGHSPGSMCLLLDDGQALVGDAVFNGYPFGLGSIFPPFAHDPDQVLRDWQMLLAAGVKTLYPGHGPALDIEELGREYLRRLPRDLARPLS